MDHLFVYGCTQGVRVPLVSLEGWFGFPLLGEFFTEHIQLKRGNSRLDVLLDVLQNLGDNTTGFADFFYFPLRTKGNQQQRSSSPKWP